MSYCRSETTCSKTSLKRFNASPSGGGSTRVYKVLSLNTEGRHPGIRLGAVLLGSHAYRRIEADTTSDVIVGIYGFCTFFNEANVHLGTQRQVFPVRSIPVGPVTSVTGLTQFSVDRNAASGLTELAESQVLSFRRYFKDLGRNGKLAIHLHSAFALGIALSQDESSYENLSGFPKMANVDSRVYLRFCRQFL